MKYTELTELTVDSYFLRYYFVRYLVTIYYYYIYIIIYIYINI